MRVHIGSKYSGFITVAFLLNILAMVRRGSKKSKKRAVRATAQSPMESVHNDLLQLIRVNRQQINFGQPNVADSIFPTIKQHVYVTVVNTVLGTITTSTTASISSGFQFRLSDLPQASVFTSSFDRYRFLDAQLQFNPTVAAPTSGGPLITAIDYNDASAPSVEIQQRETAMTTPIGQYFERTLKPRQAVAMYGGSTFTSYANVYGMWIDANSPSTPHYGLKYYVPVQATATTIYSVSARIHVQFKNNL